MVIARPNIRAPTPSSLPLLWLQLQNLRRQSEFRRVEVFNNGARVVLAPPLRLEVLILQSIKRLKIKARAQAIETFGGESAGNGNDDVFVDFRATLGPVLVSPREEGGFQAGEADIIRRRGERFSFCHDRVRFRRTGG